MITTYFLTWSYKLSQAIEPRSDDDHDLHFLPERDLPVQHSHFSPRDFHTTATASLKVAAVLRHFPFRVASPAPTPPSFIQGLDTAKTAKTGLLHIRRPIAMVETENCDLLRKVPTVFVTLAMKGKCAYRRFLGNTTNNSI